MTTEPKKFFTEMSMQAAVDMGTDRSVQALHQRIIEIIEEHSEDPRRYDLTLFAPEKIGGSTPLDKHKVKIVAVFNPHRILPGDPGYEEQKQKYDEYWARFMVSGKESSGNGDR